MAPAMIADLDTRLWASPSQLGPALEAAMRRRNAERVVIEDANEEAHAAASAPVHRTFVHGFRSRLLEGHIPVDFIAQAVRRRPDRLLGVAGIDPTAPGWTDEFDRAIELGFVGVSVCPGLQGYPPTHSAAMRLWERCAQLKLPVMVSRIGVTPLQATLAYDRPILWDEPLQSIPGLTVVLPSLGWPSVEETLAVMEKYERLFAHLAGLARRPLDAYRWLNGAVDRGVIDRVLFASGFPNERAEAAIARLYAVQRVVAGTALPSVPRRLLEAIIERDVFAALNIPDRADAFRGGSDAALLEAARARLVSDPASHGGLTR
jgi:hypothetical protein